MTTVGETTPYAWPYDADLALGRLALLVCGADEHWAMRTPGDDAAEANLRLLRAAADSFGVPCYLIMHERSGRRAPVGLPSEPMRSIEPAPTELVVRAAGIDGFFGSPLDACLRRRGRDQLLLVGRGLETTVHSTLRTANDAGYECLTVSDACGVIDSRCRAASISSIEMSGGIFGAVGSTGSVLAALRTIATNQTAQSSVPHPREPDPLR